jgi:hypothetical protein
MSIIDFVINDCDDLACHIGTTFTVDLQIIEECTGLPVDLTNYTAKLTVVAEGVATPILEIDGVISTPKTDGFINFTATPTETDELTAGMYSYYLNLTTGPMVYRECYGLFEVTL